MCGITAYGDFGTDFCCHGYLDAVFGLIVFPIYAVGQDCPFGVAGFGCFGIDDFDGEDGSGCFGCARSIPQELDAV